DDAVGRDVGDGVVARAEVAERRHVGPRAVGELGQHAEPDAPAGPQDGLAGADVEAADLAAAGGPAPAGGDPLAQDVVLPGAGGEAPAALVGDGGGRLEQQQAAVGVVGVGAAAEAVAREGAIIEAGIVAEEAEPEAALALERPVTGA